MMYLYNTRQYQVWLDLFFALQHKVQDTLYIRSNIDSISLMLWRRRMIRGRRRALIAIIWRRQEYDIIYYGAAIAADDRLCAVGYANWFNQVRSNCNTTALFPVNYIYTIQNVIRYIELYFIWCPHSYIIYPSWFYSFWFISSFLIIIESAIITSTKSGQRAPTVIIHGQRVWCSFKRYPIPRQWRYIIHMLLYIYIYNDAAGHLL